MFGFIKKKLQAIYTHFTSKIAQLLGKDTLSQDDMQKLEVLLLSADTGVSTTRTVMSQLQEKKDEKPLEALRAILLHILTQVPPVAEDADVFVLVGINGSGKTTFAGKLAHRLTQEGKKVLLVAADTFRAAAPEQLRAWASRTGADFVPCQTGQDPAAVVFKGCQTFKDGNYDAVIIDTAGRLQTKVNLMNELAKIKRVITKQLPDARIQTLLTIDAMLGQNSFEQAQLFKESTNLDGIVLSKMDGTGKGGIVFAIADTLHVPVAYVSYGETIDSIQPFDAHEYVNELVNEKL